LLIFWRKTKNQQKNIYISSFLFKT
jgi:hypothetical protein